MRRVLSERGRRGRTAVFAAAISTIALAVWAVPALADLPLPSPSLPPLPTPKLPISTPKLPISTPNLPLPSPSLPVSLTPLPTPSVPALPTPSLPVSLTPTPPSASVPPIGASAPPGSSGSGAGSQGKGDSSTAPSQPAQGVTIPFTGIVVASTLDAALLVALAVLPLLFGIWLLLFGRTWSEARKTRDARIRMALASDLGLSPRELTSLSTKGLFKLREQAAFDDLTGVLRRAAGVAAAEREIARARRNRTPLTVAFLDVDGLKQTNDVRGHAAGDLLLKGLASGLKSGLRGQDLVLRYGGDEFVCILPDTPADGAREKLRQIQAELAPAGIGFSVGLVQLERSDDVVSLLGRADSQLYDAKARRGEVRPLRAEKVQGDEGRKRVPA